MIHVERTVLITGANGFLGQNIGYYLEEKENISIIRYTKSNSVRDLLSMVGFADFVFHFAGENRSKNTEDFEVNNVELTEEIVKSIKESEKDPILFFSSSTQVQNHSIYGSTKRKAEKLIAEAKEVNNIKAFYYRFPNLFGPFSRPNYNSVVATFCHNISRNRPIMISDPVASIEFLFGHDIAFGLNNLISSNFENYDFITQTQFVQRSCTLGSLVSILNKFHSAINLGKLPVIVDDFDIKLFYTYVSYMPRNRYFFEIVETDSAIENFTRRLTKKNVLMSIEKSSKELKPPLDCLLLMVKNEEASFKIKTSKNGKPFIFNCKKNTKYIIVPKRLDRFFITADRNSSLSLKIYTLLKDLRNGISSDEKIKDTVCGGNTA